jgi:hypothetical protein
MTITLSELVYAAKTKPLGFLEEALRRGVVKNECLELSDGDYEFIKNNFSLSSDKKQSARVAFIDPSANIKVSRLF